MKKPFFKSAWRIFFKYFSQGLLYLLPIGVTVFILLAVFQKLDSLIEFKTPGLGILTLVLFITFTGILGSLLISSPIFTYVTKLIEKTPVVKIIYNSIKDLLSVFVGSKKKFTEPVIVKLSENFDLEQIGFITQTDLTDLGIEKDKVSVYIPYSFSFMGTIYIVPSKNVKIIKASPQDALKFIVSGGFSNKYEAEEKE
ncbi:MAG: hypothetical protein AUJ98_04040 [Bacteroidetes bacterium CG2_30_33_31]|nr:MAG: hypothetical protein AUJ98_04040 [Bacteroidetes bacterium CG2_30_33_31]